MQPASQRTANQPHRAAMLQAAENAAAIVLPYFEAIRAGGAVELGSAWKSEHPHDVVTHADRQGQDIIETILLGAFPDYGFYGEENGRNVDNPPRREGERRFVVDPVDGTHNFTKGIPDFSIAIALQEARGGRWKNIAGALQMPAHGEVFFAEGGEAARIHQGKITPVACAVSLTQGGLAGVHVEDAIYSRFHGEFQEAVLRYRVLLEAQGARNIKSYSTAQRLGEIAAGRIPALAVGGDFFEWDVAAGLAIAGQAGATLLERRDLGLPVIIVGATPELAYAVHGIWLEALG